MQEARRLLPKLIEAARRGESAIITKHGRPCAAIVPLDRMGGELSEPRFTDLAGSGKGLWGADPARFIESLREEWD